MQSLLHDVEPGGMQALSRWMRNLTGNLEPILAIFPNYVAPIVRNTPEGREPAGVRWGMPSSQFALMKATKKRAARLQAKGHTVDFNDLLRLEPGSGTTNIRNVGSRHWQR